MVTSARTEYKTWSIRRVVRQSVTDWLNPARVAGGALSTALLQETGFRAILGLLIVVSALSFLLIPPFELISGGADSLGSAAVQFGGPALSALIFFLIVAALSVRGRSSMAHALLIGTFVLQLVETAVTNGLSTSVTSQSFTPTQLDIFIVVVALIRPRREIVPVYFLMFLTVAGASLVQAYNAGGEGTVAVNVAAMFFTTLPVALLLAYWRSLFDGLFDRMGYLYKQAESASNAKSQFLAAMSHELRTPLNIVGGHVQMVLLGMYMLPDGSPAAPAAGNLRNMMDSADRNIQRLEVLVAEILDLARVEAGTAQTQMERLGLAAYLSEIISDRRLVAEAKGIELRLEVKPDAPEAVICDRECLLKIVGNLIGNALKFTEEGRVVVSAESVEGGRWQLRVSDTGIGIPASETSKIFGRFYQVYRGDARKYQGAGLGLSLVRETAEFLGGSVAVESVEGCGSTFSVMLPVVCMAAGGQV